MGEKEKEEFSLKMEELLTEISELKDQLEYEKNKHKQWKSLATTFHDTLWQLVEEYVMT